MGSTTSGAVEGKKAAAVFDDISCRVWTVRHGERADEVRDHEWNAKRRERWYDPPLTESGKHQGHLAGIALLKEPGASAFDVMFCSPLQRTVETAAEIAKILGLPLKPVYGLAACAAAVQRIGLSDVAFLDNDWISESFPEVTVLEADCTIENSVSAMARLARPGLSILVVTHRELISDVIQIAGVVGRVPRPYCCRTEFKFDLEQRTWAVLRHFEPQYSTAKRRNKLKASGMSSGATGAASVDKPKSPLAPETRIWMNVACSCGKVDFVKIPREGKPRYQCLSCK